MTTARFTGAKNADNTGQALSLGFQSVAYGATIALTTKPFEAYTLVQVAQLTGALTMTAGVGSSTTPPFVGDEIQILFSADATNRVVTFSTGFLTSGTMTVSASKTATIRFIFNGTAWQEMGRTVTA
jgi:hypothetical protein